VAAKEKEEGATQELQHDSRRERSGRYCKAAAAIFQYSKYQKVIFFIVTLQPRNNTTHGRNSGEFAPT